MAEMNRYTEAIIQCLEQWNASSHPASTDASTIQRLTIMIQGRLLDHLVSRIAYYYKITDPAFQEEIATLVVDVFSDELFGQFRKKMDASPMLVIEIAQRIVEAEMPHKPSTQVPTERINRRFMTIICQYLHYRNMEHLLGVLKSDARIQKVVLSALLKKKRKRPLTPLLHYCVNHQRFVFLASLYLLPNHLLRPSRRKFFKRSHSRHLH